MLRRLHILITGCTFRDFSDRCCLSSYPLSTVPCKRKPSKTFISGIDIDSLLNKEESIVFLKCHQMSFSVLIRTKTKAKKRRWIMGEFSFETDLISGETFSLSTIAVVECLPIRAYLSLIETAAGCFVLATCHTLVLAWQLWYIAFAWSMSLTLIDHVSVLQLSSTTRTPLTKVSQLPMRFEHDQTRRHPFWHRENGGVNGVSRNEDYSPPFQYDHE